MISEKEIQLCSQALLDLRAVGRANAVTRLRARIKYNDYAIAAGLPRLLDRPFRKRYVAAGAFSCAHGLYFPITGDPGDFEAFDLYLRKKAYGEFSRIRAAYKKNADWLRDVDRRRSGQLDILFAEIESEARA